MTLYDVLTREYYVHMDFDPRVDTFLVTCFVKRNGGVLYLSKSYAAEPHVSEVVQETKRFRCVSTRPFILDTSPMDGSVTAPVFHCLNAFCEESDISLKDLYNEVYGADILTSHELEQCLLLAKWQGVEPIPYWNESAVQLLYRGLVHIHHRQLAEALVKVALPHVVI